MTKKEALEILKDVNTYGKLHYPAEAIMYIQATDIAIEVLEAAMSEDGGDE